MYDYTDKRCIYLSNKELSDVLYKDIEDLYKELSIVVSTSFHSSLLKEKIYLDLEAYEKYIKHTTRPLNFQSLINPKVRVRSSDET